MARLIWNEWDMNWNSLWSIIWLGISANVIPSSGPSKMEQKGYESMGYWTQDITLTFGPAHELNLRFSMSQFWRSCVSGTDGSDLFVCVCVSPGGWYHRLLCSQPDLELKERLGHLCVCIGVQFTSENCHWFLCPCIDYMLVLELSCCSCFRSVYG